MTVHPTSLPFACFLSLHPSIRPPHGQQYNALTASPPCLFPGHADFNIALVDSTLHLLHFTRMPAAKLTSIAIAIDKAYTAAGHRLPTASYSGNPVFLPGGAAYGIHNSNGGRFMLIGGGLPITVDGVVVGAIGVSTGTPAQDGEVAKAGVEAVEAFVQRSRGPRL